MKGGLKSLLFCSLTIGAISQSVYAGRLEPHIPTPAERKAKYEKIRKDLHSNYYQPLCNLNEKEFKGLPEEDKVKDGQIPWYDTLYEIVSNEIIKYIAARLTDGKSFREAFLYFEPSEAFGNSPLVTYVDYSKDLRDMLYSKTYIRKVCSVFLGIDKTVVMFWRSQSQYILLGLHKSLLKEYGKVKDSLDLTAMERFRWRLHFLRSFCIAAFTIRSDKNRYINRELSTRILQETLPMHRWLEEQKDAYYDFNYWRPNPIGKEEGEKILEEIGISKEKNLWEIE